MKSFNLIIICLFFILGMMLLIFSVYKEQEKTHEVKADLLEESTNVSLPILGKVPDWLSGTLIRNGPLRVYVDGKTNPHWFDGLAMLHSFSFEQGKVTYTNRFLRSDAYKTVFDKGSISYDDFAQDPCRSIFKDFVSLFIPNPTPPIQNANVNVAKLADQYVALTETPLPVRFDLKTLDTLGVLSYTDKLPQERCWESAHPHHNNLNRDTINYLVSFGQKSSYIIYLLKDGLAKRNVIAEIPVDFPSYMHSFAVTKNYIILTEYPFIINPLDLMLKGQPFIKNYSWVPSRGTQFIVIDRNTGSLVGQYSTKPFFAFHHVNAFEEGNDLLIDIITYDDAKIIQSDALYAEGEHSANEIYHTKLERFTLSILTGKIKSEILFNETSEFPRINDNYDGQPYRYAYTTGISKPLNEVGGSLYKIDTKTKDIKVWSSSQGTPGEPVFVPAADAATEDQGVVLAVIIDHVNHDSFLLILDGQSFTEIGRARAPHPIPEGLHGQFFK